MNAQSEGTSRANRVMHLCGDFAKQQIYTQLVAHLAGTGVHQVVYAAVRTAGEAAWRPAELTDVPCHFRHILRGRHRIFFRSKVRRVARDLAAQVDVSEIMLTHAHFLYSDGAVALAMKQRFGLPFVVAVRNTDINAFMRYRPDLSRVRDRVLEEAARVIFLGHAYERRLGERLDADLRSRVQAKTVIIPNGVHHDWLASPPALTRPERSELSLLYVGDFSRNKNVPALLAAAEILRRSRKLRLTLVGGGGDGAQEVERLLASGTYPFATHVGRVNDPTALRAIYRDHDVFVMVSIHETFGVVYAEALSQGLPIVHSSGQGVDGYFPPSTVAEAADPRDPADIAARIEAAAERLPAVRQKCVLEAGRFNWNLIARTYADLYAAVAREAGVLH